MQRMTTDERVTKSFLESYQLVPERFTEQDMLNWGGTVEHQVELPDFKVKTPDGGLFYCEVKSLSKAPNEEDFVSFNRLSNNIHKACAQFETVNSRHIVPNVLVWVNHEMRRHPDDLIIVLKGFIDMSDGTRVGGVNATRKGVLRIRNTMSTCISGSIRQINLMGRTGALLRIQTAQNTSTNSANGSTKSAICAVSQDEE
jgi:hypothetical protein